MQDNTAHLEDFSNPQRQQYTVGWICALPTEATAAQTMLDETYPGLPSKNVRDSNVYTFGGVHNHKVVIALLSSGVHGTNSAATTAKEMLLNFLNNRFGLLVGVGGEIPSEEHDIRLGDVVVSKPHGTVGMSPQGPSLSAISIDVCRRRLAVRSRQGDQHWF